MGSMAYNSFVESLEFNHLNILDGEFQERVMYMAGWEMSQRHQTLMNQYMEEVMIDYQNAVKQSVVNYELEQPEKVKYFESKKVSSQSISLPVPRRGCAPLPSSDSGIVIITYVGTSDEPRALEVPDIVERAEIVAEDLCLALPEFLTCVQSYYDEISIRDVCLMDFKMESLKRPIALADFSSCQRQHIVDSLEYLRNEWTISIIHMVEELIPVGGFNFDLSPDSSEAQYRDSIIRFVKMISLVMADELRTCIINSLESYSFMWSEFKEGDTETEEGIKGVTGASTGNPMFKIQLNIDERKVIYEPSLESFVDSTLYAIDDVIRSAVGIEDISSKLNTSLDSTVEFIPTVGPNDKQVLDCKATVAEIFERNFVCSEVTMK